MIFWNYLRNGRGSTAVAAYSTRARPEAGVAMPLDWGELDAIGAAADHFTLANGGAAQWLGLRSVAGDRYDKATVAGKEKPHSAPVRVRPHQKELPRAPCVGAHDASTLKESPMTIKSMNDLFLHTLKDLYYAEKQIYKNLPKMAKSAKSPDLKRAFENTAKRPTVTLKAWRLFLINVEWPRAPNAARRWMEFWRKRRTSWRRSRTVKFTTRACLRRRKPWSTTRLRVTGP